MFGECCLCCSGVDLFSHADRRRRAGDQRHGGPMLLHGGFRLMRNDRVVPFFLEDRRRYLPAQVAIDTCVIDEEVAGHILGISILWIGHP